MPRRAASSQRRTQPGPRRLANACKRAPSDLSSPVDVTRLSHPKLGERNRGRKSGSMSSMQATRVKISVSLPSDLVDRIDRAARSEARSRSRVLEGWLRATARERTAQELERATIAYYESLTPEDRREAKAMSAASSRAARRLRVDDPPRSVTRRRQ